MRFIIRATFGIVPVGGIFQMQRTTRPGTPADTTPVTWLKVSTRTARVNGNGAVFYFSKHDTVWCEAGAAVSAAPNKKEER